MNVLLLVCDSVIRNTKYESYLRFFSGFLLMLCLMKPLIDLAGAEQYMDASYILHQLQNEWRMIRQSEDLSRMREEIQEEYDRAVEEQVTGLGASFSIHVTKVQVRWASSGDAIQSLRIRGEEMEEGGSPQIHAFREALEEYYHLDTEQITITLR